MAIYHCSIKVGSRGAGRSACAAAAYRAGEKIKDRETGVEYDFTRKSGVVFSEVLLPQNAPEEFSNRETLWNVAQVAEKAKNGQLFREVEVALPRELTREQQIDVIREYCRENFVLKGMCADWCLHDKDDGNPHAHIMLTMRGIDENGRFLPKRRTEYARDEKGERIPVIDKKTGMQKIGAKGRRMWQRVEKDVNDWNNKENAELWRESWASKCNQYLPVDDKIDHRSFDRRGIDRIPTKHEGFAARQLERRGGKSTVCQVNRNVKAINEARHQLELERRSVIVEMERERIDRALRQMQDDIQTIRNYRSDRTKNNEMAAGEKSKMQKQIEAIRRRKRTEKAAANKAAHDKTEAHIQSTAGKIEEIKASRFKAASNRAVETAIQAIEKGSEVAKDVIKNLTPEDVGKLAEAAQKTFVKELHPKSNLSQINNIAANALKIICDCAAAGDRGAAAFLHKSKQELGLPKDWEYMTEADKDEARLHRAYSDDYSDDKSLMSDYMPQMPTPEPPAPKKKPKRVRTRELGGR